MYVCSAAYGFCRASGCGGVQMLRKQEWEVNRCYTCIYEHRRGSLINVLKAYLIDLSVMCRCTGKVLAEDFSHSALTHSFLKAGKRLGCGRWFVPFSEGNRAPVTFPPILIKPN